MKPVTKFRADDGREFDTVEKCHAHEALVAAAADVMAPLGPKWKDEGCKFANGDGFIQHDMATVAEVRDVFKALALSRYDHIPKDVSHYYIGRYLDDSGSALYRVWGRLANIDKKGREWGQGFYAHHPEKGTQTCLDDRR